MGQTKTIRVLIIDDSEAVVGGITRILRDVSDIDATGLLTDGDNAAEQAESVSPDVVVVDAQMPALDGVSVTRQIRERMPDVGILFMTVHPGLIDAAIEAGADGYIVKDSDRQEFADAIRRVAYRMPSTG